MAESKLPEGTSEWERVGTLLHDQVGPAAFDRWFADCSCSGLTNGKRQVCVPNQMYQFWMESNYQALVEEAFAALDGEKVSVEFCVTRNCQGSTSLTGKAGSSQTSAQETKPSPDKAKSAGSSSHQTPITKPKTSASAKEKKLKNARLKADFTFDTFVVGPANQFAQAAAISVAKAPSRSYNPLFLHGESGLGKTHLMQAIGYEILRNSPKARVLYLTSETFANEFIEAISNHSLPKFRKRYRTADVLLIDDVQFLGGKERSQDEFFHTFNTLLDGHKQVVLSSDCPACEISQMDKRLISRFEWGLSGQLQAPDTETRMAILNQKMRAWPQPIEPHLVRFLAERIRRNVRRLEGGLMRVASLASLKGRMPSQNEVEILLQDLLREEVQKVPTIDSIQRKVAEHFDIRVADMTSRRRPAHIAFPRQVAMYLSRQLTPSSLADIGEAFGGRDHGTVIHACKAVTKRMETDSAARQAVLLLEDFVQQR
ncbi:MAG: chromosomal replication initiator protein DnaA [Verrucomicrobiota bacterium]